MGGDKKSMAQLILWTHWWSSLSGWCSSVNYARMPFLSRSLSHDDSTVYLFPLRLSFCNRLWPPSPLPIHHQHLRHRDASKSFESVRSFSNQHRVYPYVINCRVCWLALPEWSAKCSTLFAFSLVLSLHKCADYLDVCDTKRWTFRERIRPRKEKWLQRVAISV